MSSGSHGTLPLDMAARPELVVDRDEHLGDASAGHDLDGRQHLSIIERIGFACASDKLHFPTTQNLTVLKYGDFVLTN